MIVRPMNSSASMDWWDLSFKKSTSINPITFLLSRSRIQPPSLCYRGLAVRKRWTTRPENNDWIEGFPFSKIRDPAFKPVLHQLNGQKLDDDICPRKELHIIFGLRAFPSSRSACFNLPETGAQKGETGTRLQMSTLSLGYFPFFKILEIANKKLWFLSLRLRLMPGQRLNHQDQDPAVKLVLTWKLDLCQPAIKHWFLRITVRDWTTMIIIIRILPSNLCQFGNRMINS